MYKYIIIGAGITGVTLGRLLQEKGIDNFLILESESVAGGLCRTRKVGNHYLDIGGGHFLCSKFDKVYDFIFSHIPKSDFNFFDRVSKIRLKEDVVDYPLESNLWQLPADKQIDFLISVVKNGQSIGSDSPTNYEAWIRWKLGDQVADQYMIPYNKKIWGVDSSEMDIDWLHKIPELNIREIVQSSLTKSAEREKMPSHVGFYYPKHGGFGAIFEAISKPLHEKILTNQRVTKMVYDNNKWTINDNFEAQVVINTAPWPFLSEALQRPDLLTDSFDKLRYNSLVVSLWEENYEHDWHWVYDPNLGVEYHREFFINNFAPYSHKNGIYTETNILRWPGQTKKWIDKNSVVYEYINGAAYPIPVLGHANAIKNILSYYEQFSLFGVGRWGQWQYLNADVCILEAMKFLDQHVD